MPEQPALSKRFLDPTPNYALEFADYHSRLISALAPLFRACADAAAPFREIQELPIGARATIVGLVHKRTSREFDIIVDDPSFDNLTNCRACDESDALAGDVYLEDDTSKIKLDIGALNEQQALLSHGLLLALTGARVSEILFAVDGVRTPPLPALSAAPALPRHETVLFSNLFQPGETCGELQQRVLDLRASLAQDTPDANLVVACSGVNYGSILDEYFKVQRSVLDAYAAADHALTLLAHYATIYLLPRGTDGASGAYPLQPISCQLLPMCSSLRNVYKVTSPIEFSVSERRFLVYDTFAVEHVLARLNSFAPLDAFVFFVRSRQLLFSGPSTFCTVPTRAAANYVANEAEFPHFVVGFTTRLEAGAQMRTLENGTTLLLASANAALAGVALQVASGQIDCILPSIGFAAA